MFHFQSNASFRKMIFILANSCANLSYRQETKHYIFLSHRVKCQITNWMAGQLVSTCGESEVDVRMCIRQGFLDLTAGRLGICWPLGGVRRPQTLLCLCARVCYISSLRKERTKGKKKKGKKREKGGKRNTKP